MSTLTLTISDNGGSLQMGRADQLVLQLPENPTTGYRWQIDRIDQALELIADTYQPTPEMKPGSGGVREFRFRRVASGSARLELKNWQAWEGDRSITSRFAVTVLG